MRQLVFVFLLISVFFGVFAQAQSSSQTQEVLAGKVYDPQMDYDMTLSAQQKTYPGGIDEDELQVQAVLSEPIRKVGPNADPQSARPIQ